MPLHTHTAVPQWRARLRVHVVSPVRVAQANGRTGTLIGRRKAPKVTGTFGSGGRNHPWAEEHARSSLEPSAVSNHTRPMSWLGPASSGMYPHTNGAQCFAGGHRHRLPLTTKGLPVARAGWQAIGRPFAEGRRSTDQQNVRGAARAEVTFRSRSRERLGGTRARIEKALRAGRPAGYAGHGSRRRRRARGAVSVRSFCGHYGAGARRRAWNCRIRPAACLCSPGSDCTTRTGRSCCCAGAWVRRTAGMPALGES